MRDQSMVGALAGLIGTLVKEVIELISLLIGWSRYSYWSLAASVFVLPKDCFQFPGLLLGVLGDSILGMFLGVCFVYSLKLIGKTNLYFKGLGFGWLIWLGLFGIFINLHVVRLTPTDPGTSLSALVEHSFFGLAIAWCVDRLGAKVN